MSYCIGFYYANGFINDLLKEVEEAELGIQLNSGIRISGCCLRMILLVLVILRKICKSL